MVNERPLRRITSFIDERMLSLRHCEERSDVVNERPLQRITFFIDERMLSLRHCEERSDVVNDLSHTEDECYPYVIARSVATWQSFKQTTNYDREEH